jgi:hypothetical protein
MSDLAAALVTHSIATQAEVERALARKALYGADLATSLIEVTQVDEGRLTECLSQALQLAPAVTGELPTSQPPALGCVPKDIASRFGVFPLELKGEELVLATSDPLSAHTLEEIARLTRYRISLRYAPGPRVRQALSRDYDLPLDRRNQRALARLTGHPDPSPSLAPGPIAETPNISALPRAPSLPPIGLPDAAQGPVRAPPPASLPRPNLSAAVSTAGGNPATSGVNNTLPSATRKKSTSPGVAPASSVPLPTVAPLTAQPPTKAELPALSSRMATRPGFPSPIPPAPTSLPPAAGARSLTPVATGTNTSLAPGPNPSAWTKATASPSKLKRKARRHRGPYTAALAEEDLRSATATSEALGAFFDFAAQYFEYSALFAVHGDIAEGRDSHGPGLDRIGITAIGVPLDIPSSMSRARDQNSYVLDRLAKTGIDANLASDLQRDSAARRFILPVSVRGRSVLLLYGDEGKNDVALSDIGDVLALAPLVESSLERILVQRKRLRQGEQVSTGVRGAPSKPKFAPPSAEQRANALASALDLAALGPNMDTLKTPLPTGAPSSLPPRRHTPMVGPSTAPTITPRPPTTAPAPAQGSRPTPVIPGLKPTPKQTQPLLLLGDIASRPPGTVEDDWEIPDDPMPANVRNSSLRPPKRTSAPRALETTPADASSDSVKVPRFAEPPGTALRQQQIAAELLVTELLGGDPSAEQRLIALGVSAVAHVIKKFPGPLTHEMTRGRAASECGPVLRVLARMGEQATPFVVARTGDTDPQVRAWATLLLAELPHATSVDAVCRRLLDEHSDVARAALRSATELCKRQNLRESVAETLSNALSTGKLSEEDRFTVLQAVVELKLEHAVPRLLRMLSGDPTVAQPARWALRALTCQDLGEETAAWEGWWQANAGKARIEWLIDALAHDTAELRQSAFHELRELIRSDFGYRETLSLDQVREVQRRYLEWWKTTGKSAAP